MKHVHYDKIVAKAANMALIVLNKNAVNEWVEQEYTETDVKFSETGFGYFLCLPQHKDACLHWLNGGEVESHHEDYGTMTLADAGCIEWSVKSSFMKESIEIRIKPKKEKRWIAYTKDQKRVGVLTFDSEKAIKCHYGDEADSFHEIEVEV